MIHDFGNDFKIIVDKNINMAYKMSGNDVKENFSTKGMLLENYEQIQKHFALSIQKHEIRTINVLENETAKG